MKTGVAQLLVVPILSLIVLAGCSGTSENTAPVSSAGDVHTPLPPPTEAGPQTVVGKVPAASGGFPSIVILEPTTATTLPPAETPYMDQVQQTFIPEVLMVRTGHPVEFRNSDDVLHNVRVREDATHQPAFNVVIPNGEKYVYTFPRDGFYDVGCDIHPGMAAQVVATTSPYTAVADDDGNFSIAGVPIGGYKAIVYAGAQKIEREVTISAGQGPLDIPGN